MSLINVYRLGEKAKYSFRLHQAEPHLPHVEFHAIKSSDPQAFHSVREVNLYLKYRHLLNENEMIVKPYMI